MKLFSVCVNNKAYSLHEVKSLRKKWIGNLTGEPIATSLLGFGTTNLNTPWGTIKAQSFGSASCKPPAYQKRHIAPHIETGNKPTTDMCSSSHRIPTSYFCLWAKWVTGEHYVYFPHLRAKQEALSFHSSKDTRILKAKCNHMCMTSRSWASRVLQQVR